MTYLWILFIVGGWKRRMTFTLPTMSEILDVYPLFIPVKRSLNRLTLNSSFRPALKPGPLESKVLTINPFTPKSAKLKTEEKTFCKTVKNKHYHLKILLHSFYLNGHTLGFHPQTTTTFIDSRFDSRSERVKARSNGHNILTTFVVTMPGQTATTTSQHFKNKRNVVTILRQSLKEFKLVTTPHNIVERGGQTLSTLAPNKCCENVVTNVVTLWSGLLATMSSPKRCEL